MGWMAVEFLLQGFLLCVPLSTRMNKLVDQAWSPQVQDVAMCGYFGGRNGGDQFVVDNTVSQIHRQIFGENLE